LALEHAGDTRKADSVYLLGVESQAQPVDWLQTQHRYALCSEVQEPKRICDLIDVIETVESKFSWIKGL